MTWEIAMRMAYAMADRYPGQRYKVKRVRSYGLPDLVVLGRAPVVSFWAWTVVEIPYQPELPA